MTQDPTNQKSRSGIFNTVIALAILAFAAIVMWQKMDPASTTEPEVAGNSEAATPEASSLKALLDIPGFTLIDQNGAPFGTSNLRGKVWVASFIFTRCKGSCPVQTAQMTQLQAHMKRIPGWQDIHMVSISADPDFDTPQILRDYADSARAVDGQWTFLTGDRDEIWTLSRAGFKLGIGGEPSRAGAPIFHSDKLVLIDRQMQVRGIYEATSVARSRRMATMPSSVVPS